MKKPNLIAGLCVALLAPLARADDAPQPPDILNSKVSLNLHEATMDDYIVELAKASGTNIIADATQFPATAAPISGAWQERLRNLMREFANERQLSWAKYDASTLLIATKPDIQALAREIVRGATFPVREEPLTDRQMETSLTEFFSDLYGPDLYTRGFARDLKIADLPPDMRRTVVAKVRDRILEPVVDNLRKGWFTDAFWKKARFQVLGIRTPDNSTVVYIGGPGGKGGETMKGFVQLESP